MLTMKISNSDGQGTTRIAIRSPITALIAVLITVTLVIILEACEIWSTMNIPSNMLIRTLPAISRFHVRKASVRSFQVGASELQHAGFGIRAVAE